MYNSKKPPSEKETFQSKPKSSKNSKPVRKTKQEESEGVFGETEGKIKEGGLRTALRVDKDYKFSKSALAPLLKHDVGDKFKFQNKNFTMTDRLKKQIRLAMNMLK
tara:strand:+ start:154 stop:471 length:318 start_codon:yes stop_codon:yes gene_type:complete